MKHVNDTDVSHKKNVLKQSTFLLKLLGAQLVVGLKEKRKVQRANGH